MYFIILSIIIIIFILFYKKSFIEKFDNDKNVFLIGDSILQNKLYATPSIEDYLSKQIHNKNLFFYAEDNTTISQCINQINQIDSDYNNNTSFIFVSIGGNDILNQIVYVNNPTIEILNNIMVEYTNLIEKLLLKMNKSNIILLNLYYPKNSHFHKYNNYIDKWNEFINDFSRKNNCKVLNLTKIMENPDDFSFRIEPSVIGGEKISNNILLIVDK